MLGRGARASGGARSRVSGVTSAPDRRRRLSAEQRRAAIVAAACAGFDERPFDQVTVADVARASDSSEPLVYHYFPTKADLYAASVAHRLAELDDAVTAALDALPAGSGARDRVRVVVDAHLTHAARHPGAWASALDGVGAEPTEAELARAAARVAHLDRLAGFLHPDPRPERHYALAGHVALLDGVTREWVRRGSREDERPAVVTTVLGSLQGGLGDWGR
ncbi:TetR family transcriptional regulator [Salana multivorans]|uniref:TetR family transcriptional regulator n=1 Tax=Salana multivorans TaxID=120377 RepID=A0A3N2D906_9MICO|nr:TetR family transcriptional regulator [Salana multivorans]